MESATFAEYGGKSIVSIKLEQISGNCCLLHTSVMNLLFSYGTPVAGLDAKGYFKTGETWSKTTSKHISLYLGEHAARFVPQQWLDELELEVK